MDWAGPFGMLLTASASCADSGTCHAGWCSGPSGVAVSGPAEEPDRLGADGVSARTHDQSLSGRLGRRRYLGAGVHRADGAGRCGRGLQPGRFGGLHDRAAAPTRPYWHLRLRFRRLPGRRARTVPAVRRPMPSATSRGATTRRATALTESPALYLTSEKTAPGFGTTTAPGRVFPPT